MIDLSTARLLLDFGARMGQGPRSEEQLEGAVAIHNILEKHRVAYLADEVGMGKTYVALGALALFRHFQPDFRVLVIAPRENIQRKWMKELGVFASFNVRFTDFRNRTIDGRPGRPLVACRNLLDFVHEVVVDPARDFFARLPSFSLGVSDADDRSSWAALRDGLLESIPWLDAQALTTRVTKDEFKDNFARSVCCALPVFDLVIVDEGHNLKHGFGSHVAARNRVLALTFGHPSESGRRRDFPNYGPRARRVLFLSATPLEESYVHIWNQLNVFGLAEGFDELRQRDVDEDAKKKVAAKFLIRRVTSIKAGGEQLTKNQYRREWRAGGVRSHDEPVAIADTRQRLVVALVQKKVAELLGSEKFNMSFQIGMLASFESFLETTRLKREEDDEASNFDDAEQTDDRTEREGIDVADVNRLSRNYRERFDEELPHPKMDALVEALGDSWRRGLKSLVFVRRVASVRELKRKLDRSYDAWLIQMLRDRLPPATRARFEKVVLHYQDEKREAEAARTAKAREEQGPARSNGELDQDDRGGTDTFFAWFFRGDGPKGVVSGANIQRRFIQTGTAYSTFFEDNFVAVLLNVPPGLVTEALAARVGLSVEELRVAISQRAARYLGRAKRHARGDRIEAVQASAIELLMEGTDKIAEQARLVWHHRFETSLKATASPRPLEVGDELEVETFFTEIRRPEWQELRTCLWPPAERGSPVEKFREAQLRAQLLATAARLGHSLIDLYVLTIGRLESLELRTLERESADEGTQARRALTDYLSLLDHQRRTPLVEREWGAFDELAEIANHYDLILDVNAPDARVTPLAETARFFGSQLRQQQPVAGMSGQINQTVVQQFRMPGYPFVLVTTDLLQEGEDLHTFCSHVYHYGISWTPSAMEQRIGRIDRVRSLTDRRLNGRERAPDGDEKLQVYYPYLADTVEILQVNRVLSRMNTFLRLMHEGLSVPTTGLKALDVGRELVAARKVVDAITTRLTTAFPVSAWALDAPKCDLAVQPSVSAEAERRFRGLREERPLGVSVKWEHAQANGRLLGSVLLSSGRQQPFALLQKSNGEDLLVRCVSPVGRTTADNLVDVANAAAKLRAHVGVILSEGPTPYEITVEGDVTLASANHDAARVGLLLQRVTESADALERTAFGDVDQPMGEFEKDLRSEGADGRS